MCSLEVKELSTLEGSPQELAALRSTLERAPELIKAGALDDTRPFWRLHANLPLLIACMALGRLAGLPPQSRSRLAAFSFQHVRTHGSGVLQSMVAAGPTLAHVQDSTANSVAVLLLQLDTVSQVLQLPEQLGTGAAALVPPQQLVSWLKDCTAVLRSLPAQGAGSRQAKCAFAIFAFNVCCVACCEALGLAVGADEQLAGDLVALLQPFIAGTAAALRLPEGQQPGGPSWLPGALAVAALMSKGLQPALERRLAADPSRAPAQLLAAAQLLHQLPDEPWAELPLGLYMAMARSLAAYCDVLAQHVDTAGAVQQPQQAALRQRLVHQLLACMAKLPGMLRVRAGQSLDLASLPEVVGLCVALLVPGDLIVELSGINESLCRGGQVAGSAQRPAPPTEQDAVAWCTSAASALRAVPLLVQARQLLPQSGTGELQQRSAAAVGYVLSKLATLAHFAGIAGMGIMLPKTRFARPAALHQAFFQLHTAGCRLVAWCDANRVGGALPLEPAGRGQLLAALSDVLVADVQLHLMEGADTSREQDLHSMALAHWPALRVLLPVAGVESSFPAWRTSGLTASMAGCIGMGPTLLGLDSELHRQFAHMLQRVPQGALTFTLQSTLVTARYGPPLAVHLLLSGHFGCMVESVLQLRADEEVDESQALLLLACAHNVSHGLHSAAQAVLDSEGAADDTHPDTQAALATLRTAQRNLDSVLKLGRMYLEDAAAALQERVLPLCRELAAALHAWWQRPEQQPALQLEAAQAAARRSCAYLRCANLGGEGGPAAGEGMGSLRCSACRTAWYCGTACSHADWRAGHRRVCKALGAARAAEKERRQQQEEEEDSCS